MLTKANAIDESHAASVFNPTSVAVIGASDNPNKVGGRPIHYMRKFGFAGRILPVNPQRSEVQGLRCFSRLDELEEVPDAAIIAVSGQAARDAVQTCARIGVGTAVVMASGFAETGAEGRARQDSLIACARSYGMRVVGPNSQGIANFASGAVLNFSTMFMEVEPMDGSIAIVSQSGAASVMPYALLREKGMGVRYLAATGNDADLGVSELTRMVASDEAVRLILVYVEALSHPEMLAEAARIAHERDAHIILLKGGRSRRGAVAAASHTGAMVGEDGALDAFLRHHGIIRARDIRDLVNGAPHFVRNFPRGEGRTVVMSHSGAVGVLCADAAEHAGLPLTELSRPTITAVGDAIPDFASAANPMDLTATLLGNGAMFPRVLGALGRDPAADMFLIGIPVAGPGYDVAGLAQTTADFMDGQRKPVAVTAPQASVRAHFEARGVPTYSSETDAVEALRQYSQPRRSASAAPVTPPDGPRIDRFGLADEAESLELLRDFGVPVVQYSVCDSAEEAVVASARLGDRYVVKGCASEVPHKSEHGLVKVGVVGRDMVRLAAAECLDTLHRLNVVKPRVIVASMEKGLHEFMLGVSVDPVFGPVVMIGEGGTLAEVRHDCVSLIAPFSVGDALEAISGLRIAPVLRGMRGQPPLDVQALAAAAVALGNFASAARETLVSVDLNPVIVKEAGCGVVAVDAIVEFKEKA